MRGADDRLSTAKWYPMSGFKKFVFTDGDEWHSEETSIGESPPMDTADAPMKRPAAAGKSSSSLWKKAYSIAHHHARKEFKEKHATKAGKVDKDAMDPFLINAEMSTSASPEKLQ